MEMSNEDKVRVCRELIHSLVKSLTEGKYYVFILDDAHNMDSASWDFLSTLCRSSRSLMVLTLRPFSPDLPPADAARQVTNVLHIHYSPTFRSKEGTLFF